MCLFHRTKCISKQGYWKKCAIRPFCWRHLAHTWRSFYSFWDLDVGLWLYLWPYPKFIWRGLLILCVRSRLNFYWINLSVVLSVQVKTFTRSLSPLQMHTAVRHNAIWDDEEQYCHQLKPNEKKNGIFQILFSSRQQTFLNASLHSDKILWIHSFEWKNVYFSVVFCAVVSLSCYVN